jgi:hypothetical protein
MSGENKYLDRLRKAHNGKTHLSGEPSKPSKPSFEGFEGVSLEGFPEIQPLIEAVEEARKQAKLAYEFSPGFLQLCVPSGL